MCKFIIIFIVICVLCILEWMREIHTFKITHYYIRSKKLKGISRERKVILLSDLHGCSYGNNNDKLLRAIAKENPDYILVAGDMLVGKPNEPTKVAEEFMTRLPEIAEVFHANGNHEQRFKEMPETYGDVYPGYIEKLERAGVHCLSNEKIELNWDDVPVNIYGLELGHKKYRKFQKQVFQQDRVKNLLGDSDTSKYNIMIAHNPTFMDNYLEWGADLVVSGHVHGGVVRIPGIGGLISPQFILFPKYSGEMKKVGDKVAVVSKGIGLHTIKVRFLNPAEVVVMHISGTEE